ncbi:MAG: putative 4-hydroxybenzoate polyprenyltransferase [Armatimonadetes bacterium]|nr:putative 4-hydroxybenzoate polyprenyltransferase [Armatimonadota bacterium]
MISDIASSPFRKVKIMMEMIKFEHTIFALPFAMSSALVAAKGMPTWHDIVLVLIAMVGARSAAMAFNRIADAKIDALNPRTASRALPNGEISLQSAWIFTILSAALLVLAAYELNTLAFVLSPVALAAILGYSYTKRFTAFSHLWLGLCLGIAPVGAWIAVKGEIGFPSMALSAAVILWTAGFDIIYSLQDVDFDRKMGLFSLPSRIGPAGSLIISRVFHALMVALLVWFGVLTGRGSIYYVGAAFVGVFLAYEQSLVSAHDISRANAAFFIMNGCVSIAMLAFVAVDVLF